MSIDLPSPVALYVDNENTANVDALGEYFAPDATVRDESRTYEGLAAIREWKVESRRQYSHSLAPLAVSQRDGRTVLKAVVAGTFPGSPVTLDFSFRLENGKIAALEIQG